MTRVVAAAAVVAVVLLLVYVVAAAGQPRDSYVAKPHTLGLTCHLPAAGSGTKSDETGGVGADFYSVEAMGPRPGGDRVDMRAGPLLDGTRSERKWGHYRVTYLPDHEPLQGALDSPIEPSKVAHLL